MARKEKKGQEKKSIHEHYDEVTLYDCIEVKINQKGKESYVNTATVASEIK
jgi:hypothetical protein